jgi:hypothetical protein
MNEQILKVNEINYKIEITNEFVTIIRWNEVEDFSSEITIDSTCGDEALNIYNALVQKIADMTEDSEIETIYNEFSIYEVE